MSSWSVAMGTASYFPRIRLHGEHTEVIEESPGENGNEEGNSRTSRLEGPEIRSPKGCFTDQSCGTLGLMVWYPILSTCMAVGDKLACIALRDTCILLRMCYGLFRNDITRWVYTVML